jgi:hypothetical protein
MSQSSISRCRFASRSARLGRRKRALPQLVHLDILVVALWGARVHGDAAVAALTTLASCTVASLARAGVSSTRDRRHHGGRLKSAPRPWEARGERLDRRDCRTGFETALQRGPERLNDFRNHAIA